jgi:hypothetical protein
MKDSGRGLFIVSLNPYNEKSSCNLLAYEQSNYLMGRTIPSFRIASVQEEEEWKSFRQALDKKDRKIFDDMFSIAHFDNSACSFAAKPIRIQPIFMSIIFHHYKQLMEIKQELHYTAYTMKTVNVIQHINYFNFRRPANRSQWHVLSLIHTLWEICLLSTTKVQLYHRKKSSTWTIVW